jgi:hypothetical protein
LVITRGIREFAARDWTTARERKDAYWADRIARLGPTEALRIADEVRRQVRASIPGWPTAADRQADLQGHVRLAELLQRAGSARRL